MTPEPYPWQLLRRNAWAELSSYIESASASSLVGAPVFSHTSVLTCCCQHDLPEELLRQILAKLADPGELWRRDRHGYCPLHYAACHSESLGVLELLISRCRGVLLTKVRSGQ